MKSKLYRDKTWLVKEYVNNKRSTVDLGQECGVAAWTINTWLKKHNIEVRDSNEPLYQKRRKFKRTYDVSREYFEQEYLTRKKTLNQIASELGCR